MNSIQYKPLTDASNSHDIREMLSKNNIKHKGFYDSVDGLRFELHSGKKFCVKDGETLSVNNGQLIIDSNLKAA